MKIDEVDFLRRRIAAERRLVDHSTCDVAAMAHYRMLRLYEARLERRAEEVVEGSRPMDAAMVDAMAMIA